MEWFDFITEKASAEELVGPDYVRPSDTPPAQGLGTNRWSLFDRVQYGTWDNRKVPWWKSCWEIPNRKPSKLWWRTDLLEKLFTPAVLEDPSLFFPCRVMEASHYEAPWFYGPAFFPKDPEERASLLFCIFRHNWPLLTVTTLLSTVFSAMRFQSLLISFKSYVTFTFSAMWAPGAMLTTTALSSPRLRRGRLTQAPEARKMLLIVLSMMTRSSSCRLLFQMYSLLTESMMKNDEFD